MIILDVEQGSQEWKLARLGLVSASRFKDVMTEPRSKSAEMSDTAYSYMCELIAEIVTGEQSEIKGAALEWGTINEPEARDLYDMIYADVQEAGLILHDSRRYGASPDGLIGDDGMIEIKCPYNSTNHVKTVLSGDVPKEHIPQIQGNLMVNGRQWCDFISFDPRISGKGRFFVKRVYRDDEYIGKMQDKIENFIKKMDAAMLSAFGSESTKEA